MAPRPRLLEALLMAGLDLGNVKCLSRMLEYIVGNIAVENLLMTPIMELLITYSS